MPQELRKLAQQATDAGWRITVNGQTHFVWESPEGAWVTTPFSASDWRSWRNARSALRKAGLEAAGARPGKSGPRRTRAEVEQRVLELLRQREGRWCTVTQIRKAARTPEVDEGLLRALKQEGRVERSKAKDQDWWRVRRFPGGGR